MKLKKMTLIEHIEFEFRRNPPELWDCSNNLKDGMKLFIEIANEAGVYWRELEETLSTLVINTTYIQVDGQEVSKAMVKILKKIKIRNQNFYLYNKRLK